MAKLTYWCVPIKTDNACYNIRAKTKRDALAQVKEYSHHEWGEIEKVEVYYDDSFDLMCQAMGEGGLLEPR